MTDIDVRAICADLDERYRQLVISDDPGPVVTAARALLDAWEAWEPSEALPDTLCEAFGDLALVVDEQPPALPTAAAVAEHVAGILFDSLAEPDPECLLCQAASRDRVWQARGFDDPLRDYVGEMDR